MMVVTPWDRLSEEILKEAILSFYKDHTLIPVGVAEMALPPWAEKMAFALHKLVRRFRKLYEESPKTSRSVPLQELKDRCMMSKIPYEKPSSSEECLTPSLSSRSLSESDLEQLPAAAPIDWAMVLSRLRAQKDKSADKSLSTAPVVEKASVPRPVAAPLRESSKWALPQFVLDGLAKKEAPKAFPTTGGAEDLDGQTLLDHEQAVASKPKKKQDKKKSKVNKKKGKGKEVFTAEEEKALAPMDFGAAAPEKAQLVAAPEKAEPVKRSEPCTCAEMTLYEPGKFAFARKAFIARERAAGASFKDANTLWMLSNERASLLENMSPAELKMRRFI